MNNKLIKKIWKNPIAKIAIAALWAMAVCYLLQKVLIYPILWIFGKTFLLSPVGETVFTAIYYTFATIIILFGPKIISKKWSTTRQDLGLNELPTYTDIGIAILGFLVAILISGAVFQTLSYIFPNINLEQAQEIGFSTSIIGFDRIVAFISIVIIAPIAEEIIFRGWLYHKIRKYSSIQVAIVVVSLLFAILHGQLNVGITVGILSIVMCIEREITGSIYAGMLTHIIKNGIAFWILFVL